MELREFLESYFYEVPVEDLLNIEIKKLPRKLVKERVYDPKKEQDVFFLQDLVRDRGHEWRKYLAARLG